MQMIAFEVLFNRGFTRQHRLKANGRLGVKFILYLKHNLTNPPQASPSPKMMKAIPTLTYSKPSLIVRITSNVVKKFILPTTVCADNCGYIIRDANG